MFGPMVFQNVLVEMLNLAGQRSEKTLPSLCRAHIGVSFAVCADLWKKVQDNGTMPEKAEPKHLIWALIKLRMNNSSKQDSVMFKADEKTVRKWVWMMLEAIVSIKSSVVSVFSAVNEP